MYSIPQVQVLRCKGARSSCICTRRGFRGWGGEGGFAAFCAFAFWLGEERIAGAEALCCSFAWRLKSANTGRRWVFAVVSRAGGGGEERSIAGDGGGDEGGVDRAGASASEEIGGCGLELGSGAETTLVGDEARVVSPSSITVCGGSTRRRLVGGSSS